MEKKLKICLFTVMYKRLELTDYVLSYYKNIKHNLKDVCDLEFLCVGSDSEKGKEIAEKNGFEYYEFQNNPLSQKHNYAVKMCKKHDPDGVIHVGSDDIMTLEFFTYYIQLLRDGFDFCGIKDIYFLTKNKLSYWSGYSKDSHRYNESVGAGRMYSKSIMEKMNWQPWSDSKVNRNLDSIVTNNLKKIGKYKNKIISCKDVNGYLIDIKTEFNLSNINHFTINKEYDLDYIKNLNINYEKIEHLLINKNSKFKKYENKQLNKKDWWIKKRTL